MTIGSQGGGGERKPGRHNAPPTQLPVRIPAASTDFRPVTRDPSAAAIQVPEAVRARPAAYQTRVTPREIVYAIINAAKKRGGKRKLFVPNNPALYNAALIGFVGGVNQARTIGNQTSGLTAQAVLFAQLVDTDIPTDGGLTQSKIDLLTDIVSNVFGDLYPMDLEESDYTAQADAVVALYNEA